MNEIRNNLFLKNRKILVGAFFAAIFLLLLNNYSIYFSFEDLKQHSDQVTHTKTILSEIDSAVTLITEAETSQRAFLITSDQQYLQPYERSLKKLSTSLSALEQLLQDNPQQIGNLTNFKVAIEQRERSLQNVLSLATSQGTQAAVKEVGKGKGFLIMQQVRDLATRMRDIEESSLNQRALNAQQSTERFEGNLLVSTIVNIVLFVAIFFIGRRFFNQQSMQNTLTTAMANLSTQIAGDHTIREIGSATLDFFHKQFNIETATFYVLDDQRDVLTLEATYANNLPLGSHQHLSESQLGESAKRGKVSRIRNLPHDYYATHLNISSSLGSAPATELLIVPCHFEGKLKAVIELATRSGHFTDEDQLIADELASMVGTSVHTGLNRQQLQLLLEHSRQITGKLQVQQEELRVSNEELEEQTAALEATKERLQIQQEELRQSNEELEQQAKALEIQKDILKSNNAELQKAKQDLERSTHELTVASQYKSDFLANMSHELRTPLNSLLILATILMENRDDNLTEKQIDFARTIHNAGTDLLTLINDILDLSKVEAGKLDLNLAHTDINHIVQNLETAINPALSAKKLALNVQISKDIDRTIFSDAKRIEQILRNFLSNAIKFTLSGEITLEITELKAKDFYGRYESQFSDALCFTVVDHGIGIPEEKQELIFEAFQQADGSTSRKYGGTGLGLTISRQLAHLLQGHIHLESQPGQGSQFSLIVPRTFHVEDSVENSVENKPAKQTTLLSHNGFYKSPEPSITTTQSPTPATEQSSSLANLGDIPLWTEIPPIGSRRLLIVEDDVVFAQLVANLAQDNGYQSTIATFGEEALQLIPKLKPNAIILDLNLPEMNGLRLLENLKNSPATRHIPIHIISGTDYVSNALNLGALGYLQKPVDKGDLFRVFKQIERILDKTCKKVLLVEDDQVQQDSIKHLLEGDDIQIVGVATAADAIKALTEDIFDCLILDLKLPDMSGFELLEKLDQTTDITTPPVVIYTGKDLGRDEEEKLRRYADSIIIKGAKSPERLLDEVSLFLHRIEAKMPLKQQEILQRLRSDHVSFEGKTILLVDDDLRNIFALISALEQFGLNIVVARNGLEAVNTLESNNKIDLVLMDIMMPEMDGLEATECIRDQLKLTKLPIIALTAKVMKGDQEKCIEAGANDYLPKPVDMNKLISLLKVWLPASHI